MIDSESAVLVVHVDHHFQPGQESDIVDSGSYVDAIKESSEARLTESVDILGHLDLDQTEQEKACGLLLETLKSTTHIPTLVESAAALARHGRADGTQWLINAARAEGSDLLLRIYATRMLIRVGHFDSSTVSVYSLCVSLSGASFFRAL